MVMGEDGVMTVADFVTATMDRYRQLSDHVIASMFAALDENGTGWITVERAHKELQKCNVLISPEELERLFEAHVPKQRFGPEFENVSTLLQIHFNAARTWALSLAANNLQGAVLRDINYVYRGYDFARVQTADESVTVHAS
ncbi:MAG: EF-hand domain-containing protein [Akkermansiaceae bacterium]|nr:EF-hand domain-containing protein [Akkermansiaceae bacterium]